MKVICIDDKWETVPNYDSPPDIAFGEIVTVSNAFKDKKGEWYNFQEYGDNCYEQCGFAPLSNTDETTFNRNYKRELA